MRTEAFIAVLVILQLALQQSFAHRAAIVANGLECAAIARFLCQKQINFNR